ncbi:anaerobic ribonucleoside-triphosphate reductase activating protein [Alkaliphilus serpentinus]|uniref:Anaerobic ribonucleoside-triphosphate reductase activating protein n=2 Tax=Alkaliphilus serpentinus TaxID=1482731 RepID=A0A833HLH0_9FIRM|nr:anaerobic ribonucleoside-triphosphate reductase activating protein [Alkaliphilus serpentinus]
MKILGMIKSSFIDYPGKISTVVFTGGCNFNCPFCHNGPLVKGEGEEMSDEEVIKYLISRKKYVEAVCISGGEPTLQPDLKDFLRSLKHEGFSVKLDTNGSNPHMLKELLEAGLLDYVAMDLKAPLHKYNQVTKVAVNTEDILESLQILKASSIEYQLRTTVCKELISKEDILEIAELVAGVPAFTLQNFRDNEGVLGGVGVFTPYDKETLQELKDRLQGKFKTLEVKGN